MINTFSSTPFKYLPFFNPFIQYLIAKMENYNGLNTTTNRENKLIISISSSYENFNTLPITIYSLLNQKLKPDKIILWLDISTENLRDLPYDITQFIKNGLEIKFIKDIGIYNKTYYPLQQYPESIVVTANESIYYPKNWLKNLYLSYITHPQDIHIVNGFKIIFDKKRHKEFSFSKSNINRDSSGYDIFPESLSGILYPPNCFSKEFFRSDIFLKKALNIDDSWIWTMALIHNKKFRIINNQNICCYYLNYYLYFLKNLKNMFHTENTDIYKMSINNLMNNYGQNILNKLQLHNK